MFGKVPNTQYMVGTTSAALNPAASDRDRATIKLTNRHRTDFAAMSADDLERLALRGEQLTRMFIDRWCQEL